ncbi:hypothetical protein CF326_g9407, partial [Tilletia indica]
MAPWDSLLNWKNSDSLQGLPIPKKAVPSGRSTSKSDSSSAARKDVKGNPGAGTGAGVGAGTSAGHGGQSDIWLAFCGHIQNRYPAALSELEALLNIEPRPIVCVPDDLDVKDSEYDALIWADTALWPSINGDACW